MKNILSILGAMAIVGSGMPSVLANNANHINQNQSILYTNYPTEGKDFHSTAEIQLNPGISSGGVRSKND